MKFCVITFRSVTPAQRGEGALKRAGIQCSLQRTPRWMEEQGCGYSLRLPCREMEQAIALLDRKNIPYRRVYGLQEDGTMEQMPL